MWIGVVLICMSPMDVRSCDVLVRTSGSFPTEELCSSRVVADLNQMLNGRQIYARAKCYQIKLPI